jgi:hypothetical protein
MTPRERYLLNFFRLTSQMWQAIYDFQQGLCGICKKPLDKQINTDHHHGSGLVRGLLCFRCNKTLGENVTQEFLVATLNYVTNPPATTALGGPHYGLPGRIGTKKQRKLIKKMKKESKARQLEKDTTTERALEISKGLIKAA